MNDYEPPPPPVEPDLPGHWPNQHRWQPAGILPQARRHKLTNEPMVRPSLVMLCPCGVMAHKWVPAPEDDDTKAAAGPGAMIFSSAEEGRA